MNQRATLLLDKVTKMYQQGSTMITVLDECSARFQQGHTYAITGVSGSGKSTLIHLLAGLDMPTHGSIYYNKHDLLLLKENERARWLNVTLGLVFQSSYLLKELTVIENCMLPGLIGGQTKEQCYARAHALLSRVGLCDKTDQKPSALSGGQQQRVALARALFNEPTFLLADEPTGNLDIDTGKRIIDLLLTCQQEYQMGLIISTHDEYVAKGMDHHYQVDHAKMRLIRTE